MNATATTDQNGARPKVSGKRFPIAILAILGMSLMGLNVMASDPPAVGGVDQQANTLETLQAKFEKAKACIDASNETRKATALAIYAGTVTNKLQALKKAGDLDGLVALKAEKERFDREQSVPALDNIPNESLRKAITTYHAAIATADAMWQKELATILTGYTKSLDSLMKQLTTQDKVDDALLVKAEKQKAEAGLAAIATAAATQSPPVPVKVHVVSSNVTATDKGASLKDRLVGTKWHWNGRTFQFIEFQKNGVLKETTLLGAEEKNTWGPVEWKITGPAQVELLLKNAHKARTLEFSDEVDSFTGKDADGSALEPSTKVEQGHAPQLDGYSGKWRIVFRNNVVSVVDITTHGDELDISFIEGWGAGSSSAAKWNAKMNAFYTRYAGSGLQASFRLNGGTISVRHFENDFEHPNNTGVATKVK